MRKAILLLFVLMSIIRPSSASHYAGADLRLEWISDSTYRLTLYMYRDCSGINAPPSVLINAVSSCYTTSYTMYMDTTLSGVEITPICPSAATWCNGGTLYGISLYIYSRLIVVSPCSDWVFSYSDCCRNPITNVMNPTSSNYYIPLSINNLIAPANSTPQFTNNPIIISYLSQDFTYNQGVTDPDQDSLSYRLMMPLTDVGVPIAYNIPFNHKQFLSSNPPIMLDSAIGDVFIHPTGLQSSICALYVYEWRKIGGVPVLISTTVRDMQITVVNNPNSPPKLAGINPLATGYNPADTVYFVNAAPGDTLDFNLYPYHSNPSANLNLTWNAGIPSGLFTVSQNNTPNCTGHFHWVASSGAIPSAPRCFTAKISDDNCPYRGEQVFSYCFDVNGIFIQLAPGCDTLLHSGDVYDIAVYGPAGSEYSWFVDGAPATPLYDSIMRIQADDLTQGIHSVSVRAANLLYPGMTGFEYLNLTIDHSSAVNQPETGSGFELTPNPSQGLLHVRTNTNQSGMFTIFNVRGEEVFRCEISGSAHLNLSHLSPGIYLGMFIHENQVTTRKILISR